MSRIPARCLVSVYRSNELYILAGKLAYTLMVVDSGRTRSDGAKRTLETLDKVGAKVLGVVINKMASKRASHYYYYYYYQYYASNSKRHWWQRRRQRIHPPEAPASPAINPTKVN